VTTLSPDSQLWGLIRGALAARAVGLVSDLGIAGSLDAGPQSAVDIGRETGASPDVVHRLLRALASEGVFAEREHGLFEHTDASKLLADVPWKECAHLFGGPWHRAAGELDVSGDPSFPRVFGTDFWTWLRDRPDERASFDRAMVEGTERRVDRLVDIEWPVNALVVDVGGGNGAFLGELLRRAPGLRGIVFDLPETVRDEDALGDRCRFVAGSFFDEVPPGDVYVLSTVLHNWDDPTARRILETIRRCAPRGARILILDAVVPPGNEPHGAKWLDLLQLALAGGRERTEGEWHHLLEASGLETVALEDGRVEARCP
jgi:hypothetical protein